MNEKHWMRPLKGKQCNSAHLLPWIETDTGAVSGDKGRRRLIPKQARLHGLSSGPQGVAHYALSWDGSPGGLASIIAEAQSNCGTVYLWLARGWADLVLSGMAELIDQGRYTWRFATIDGAKVLFVGQLDGRALTITSLANWTGKGGDTWSGIADEEPVKDYIDRIAAEQTSIPDGLSEPERTALGSILAILDVQETASLGRPAATAAAAGRRLWRAFAGPRVIAGRVNSAGKAKVSVSLTNEYVAPLCSRPDNARLAERHVVYPLPHEQFGSGLAGGPVTLFDVRAAYWAALAQTPTPVCYTGTVRNPSPSELATGLTASGGLALVRLDTPMAAYPLRWRGRTARALGKFWTWLCGEELSDAARQGRIAECYTWHRWGQVVHSDAEVQDRARMATLFQEYNCTALARPWRAMYSALVGSFARWDRVWEDVDHPHEQGRWATWLAKDAKTGGLVQYRSIGGRTQRLAKLGESPQAVPLLYGYVTAHLRLLLGCLAYVIGFDRLLAVTADTLWVRGSPEILGELTGKDGDFCRAALRVDTTYDRVWMDGKGRAVVQKGDDRWVHSQGVPLEPVTDAEGRVVWCAQGEWTCGDLSKLKGGVPLVRKSYDLGRLLHANDHPWRPSSPWLGLQDGVFREELLLPVLHPQQG